MWQALPPPTVPDDMPQGDINTPLPARTWSSTAEATALVDLYVGVYGHLDVNVVHLTEVACNEILRLSTVTWDQWNACVALRLRGHINGIENLRHAIEILIGDFPDGVSAEDFLDLLFSETPLPEDVPAPTGWTYGDVLPESERTHTLELTRGDLDDEEYQHLLDLVAACNAYIASTGGPITLHRTSGTPEAEALGKASRLAAKQERATAEEDGDPYLDDYVASHLCDTTVTGQAIPPFGFARHRSRANSKLGGAFGARIQQSGKVSDITVDGFHPGAP